VPEFIKEIHSPQPSRGKLDSSRQSQQQRIVGGMDADIKDFPWQVEMIYGFGRHQCGGIIVSSNWILTAAHCLDGFRATDARIVAGITKRSEVDLPETQVRNVLRVINHPKYDPNELRYDAALIELASPLDLSNPKVRAISMMTGAMAEAGLTKTGTDAIVTGWGVLKEGSREYPDVLQQVTVPIVDSAEAAKYYCPGWVHPEVIAAGLLGVGGKDSCTGDSGGPLVVKGADGAFVVAGIVSEGYGCARKNYPGLYTRVSSVEQWARETMTAPQPCGKTTCTDGAVCCNALCALCAPPGIECGALDCMPPQPDDPR